jgi:beta-galactosidase GanA
MKKFLLFPIFASILLFSVRCTYNSSAEAQDDIPHFQKTGSKTQLIVDGKPFIIIGGETGNSTASCMRYIEPFWQNFVDANLNTVLVTVNWDLSEPEEGVFDFSLVDSLILKAREHDLKLVLLWFGSWKNSMSCYVPGWVKKDTQRFPRAMDDKGIPQELLSPFSENNINADRKAFAKLMEHVKSVDEKEHTVIMIQVENEIAMIPSSRDYHPDAIKAFESDVPEKLISYLKENRDNLVPHVRDKWIEHGAKTQGSWEDLFGSGIATDDIFMAYYFALYVNKIVEAGKKVYPLPMYVNAALMYPDWLPGENRSGGPLPHTMDIWKAAGPSIDLLTPDIYFPNIEHWSDLYTQQGDPLFIPEARHSPERAIFTIGHYNSLGFSPFSIERSTGESPIAQGYSILTQLHDLITKYEINDKFDAVLLDEDNPESIIEMGDYEFTFRHAATRRPPQSRDAAPAETAGIIIQVGQNEYFIAGSGIIVTFFVIDSEKLAGILNVDEGEFHNGKWVPGRRLSGDQTHQGRHVRLNNYGIQRVELYQY